MSTTAIEFRAPAVARPTAQRVADGVVAGYVRALASASTESSAQREPQSAGGDCGQGRTSRASRSIAAAARRHPARRRALMTA